MHILGWIGGFCLAFCSLPQCIQTYKTKKADDISMSYLILWQSGIIATGIYILVDNLATGVYQTPLLVNYGVNFFMASYLIYAKFFYKNK